MNRLLLCALVLAVCAPAAVAHGQVPTSFPVQQGLPFAEPPELHSVNGVLHTTFTARRTSFEVGGVPISGKSYTGTFVGPTLRVRPGDLLAVDVRNRLGEPTNLHTHGFFVSPAGISDNVLRVMPKGTDNRVRIRLPKDIAPGTYWYHAHLHARVEEQVFSGLAGVLIVEGLEQRLSADLRDVPDHVFALKDVQVKDGAIPTRGIDSDAPTTRTVNGQVDPVLDVRTNQVQHLRLANIGADIWYRLVLDGARFTVIGEDGNPVGPVWEADELLLPPGKRYDVLVRFPEPGVHALRTLAMNTGPAGDRYPERVLATIRVGGEPAADVAMPTTLGPGPDLGRRTVDRRRTITFSENTRTNQFFINGRQYRHGVIDQYVKLGAVEEWTLRNTSNEAHPFHIHVNDFQVMSVNGQPYDARGLQDIVPLPPHGTVVVRMHFQRFLGRTVFHCHILGHEDHGMMSVIEINRTGRPPARTSPMSGHAHHGHG